ncbi:MAG: DUF3465 domain-containing protein [Ruminococcus sp.]|nr:DUF3465 domain-containing protein [Ruminococcus sp.]
MKATKKSVIVTLIFFVIGLTSCGLTKTEVDNAAEGILSAAVTEMVETTIKTTAETTTAADITTAADTVTTTAETTAATTTVAGTTIAAETTTTAAETTTTTTVTTTTTTAPADTEADYIKSLFDEKKSDVWVTGSGVVNRILKDDNEGDRHQRFILELSTGQTILFAHNIDIAPRIDDLKKGDKIEFYGEYIYSDEGGTIHWTHHDPDGSSEGGWLKKGDTIYE